MQWLKYLSIFLEGCPVMIEFVFPNFREPLPAFRTNAHMGLILPRWALFCPEYHYQPQLYTQQSQTPFGDMYESKTTPTSPQNTPFPGLKLKVMVGIMNYCLGKMDPNWAKCLKSGQNSRSGQIFLFIALCRHRQPWAAERSSAQCADPDPSLCTWRGGDNE